MEKFFCEATLPPDADTPVKPSTKDFDPGTGRGRIRVWLDVYGPADLTPRIMAMKDRTFRLTWEDEGPAPWVKGE